MTWPTTLETMSIDALTDRFDHFFAHWMFADLRIRTEHPPSHERGTYGNGNRVVGASLGVQIATLLSLGAEKLKPGQVGQLPEGGCGLPAVVTTIIHELLRRTDHAVFAGILKPGEILAGVDPIVHWAWKGHRQTVIGLAFLHGTWVHKASCRASIYLKAMENAEDNEDEDEPEVGEDDDDDGDDGDERAEEPIA